LLYQGSRLKSEATIKWLKENIDNLDYSPSLKKIMKQSIKDSEEKYGDLSYEEREKKARKNLEERTSQFFENFIGKMDVESESEQER